MVQKQFFELLRSGLWLKPADTSVFAGITEAGWQDIYRMAQQQTLTPLVFDGIETLPAELRPPRTLYMRWCTRVAQIEEANEYLNKIATELFQVYIDAGIKPVLLKGQGIATLYLRPNHRQCGDIDIYLGKESYELGNKLITEMGATSESEHSIKHAGFHYKNVHIENHRIAAALHAPTSSRKLRELIQRELVGTTHTAELNGYKVPVPPPTFNVIYLFIHAFNHFLSSGIGLRQVCDWTRLAAVHEKDIDKNEVTRQLRGMNLLRAASAFAYISVHYLGLPAGKVPFETINIKEDGEILLKDILASGNFGQYDSRIKPRPKGYWTGKWYTFRRSMHRCNELRRFAPSEASWYAVTLITGTLFIQWNKAKKTLDT